MQLLLPEDEREGDELLDDASAVKQEPLRIEYVTDHTMDDEGKDAAAGEDEEEEEEGEAEEEERSEQPGVLVSLSQLPAAPGGPERSRILALDKLVELQAAKQGACVALLPSSASCPPAASSSAAPTAGSV